MFKIVPLRVNVLYSSLLWFCLQRIANVSVSRDEFCSLLEYNANQLQACSIQAMVPI